MTNQSPSDRKDEREELEMCPVCFGGWIIILPVCPACNDTGYKQEESDD